MNKMLIKSSPNYKNNYDKNLRKALLIGLVTILFLGIISQMWQYSILIGGFVFFIYMLKALRWNRFYIEEIIIDKVIYIRYLDKGVQKIANGPKDSFKFKKKIAINKARIPYLMISKSPDGIILRQYEIGEWSESKMNDILTWVKD